MGNFQGGGNRGGGFRGGNGGGGRPNFRGGNREEVSMHKAVCDECHKECQVPFRPSGDKPVYCSDCFGNKRGDGDRGPRRDFGDRGPKREFNDRPTQSSFVKPAPIQNDMTKQLGDISLKLDRLLGAIEKFSPVKVEAKAPIKKVEVKAKVKKIVSKKKTK